MFESIFWDDYDDYGGCDYGFGPNFNRFRPVSQRALSKLQRAKEDFNLFMSSVDTSHGLVSWGA